MNEKTHRDGHLVDGQQMRSSQIARAFDHFGEYMVNDVSDIIFGRNEATAVPDDPKTDVVDQWFTSLFGAQAVAEAYWFAAARYRKRPDHEIQSIVLWARGLGFINAPVRVPAGANEETMNAAIREQLGANYVARCDKTPVYLRTEADCMAFRFMALSQSITIEELAK